MKTWKVLLAGMVCFFFYVFVKTTDLRLVCASLRQVDFRFFYLLLTTFVANWCGAVGWKYCMGRQAKGISVSYLFLIRQIGETVGLVNPAGIVGGEACKVYLLAGRLPQATAITASLLISRVIMAATQLILFMVVAVLISMQGSFRLPNLPAVPAKSMVYIAACILFLIVAGRLLVTKWKPLQTSRRAASMRLKFSQSIGEVRQAFFLFFTNDKKGLVLAAIFFSMHWVLGAVEIYLILLFLHVPATMLQAMFVDLGVTFFKTAGGFIPGQLGAEELGNRVMLGVLGPAAASAWLTLSVLRRARQLFWILFGLAAYLIRLRSGRLSSAVHGNIVRKP
ncbi:lysylphosphatidylglycerol synthase transmembrane domain-containing protein [Dyadobacter sandarakinus]|uniref:Flippase-like domain-containing protein n=1 Tax=Dyadobacter sandarakinus TaxID=2747268 RepID=A0ABX7I1T8_9BACT|nr:lysylphosphatidylglycerol synthase transmembrane domain-containing protein [Dyadobacter sandarakinus]QRQ99899.1 flippase-like domain-containing protein [Dyadobacter sandarakinus]